MALLDVSDGEAGGVTETGLGPAPRRIKRRPGRLRALFLFRLLCLPVMIIGLAPAVYVLSVGALMALGTESTATVTNRIVKHPPVRNPADIFLPPKVGYDVEYTYSTSGQTYTDVLAANADVDGPRLALGATLRVRSVHLAGMRNSVLMDPIQPTLNDLAGASIFGAGPAILAGILFYALYTLPRRRRWLLRNGAVAGGRIVERPARQAGEKYKKLQYEYVVGARHYSGKAVACREAYDQVQRGDAVAVLYNPRRPRRSVVYVLADYAVLDGRGTPVT